MKALHHREAGTVGAALLSDKVYNELICDLIHVSQNAIRLLYKCKGKDKIILITDSMQAKHVDDEYIFEDVIYDVRELIAIVVWSFIWIQTFKVIHKL